MHATIIRERSGSGGENGFLWPRVPVIISSHTGNSCLRRNKHSFFCLPSQPPPLTPALVLGSFGTLTSCANGVGVLECLGNRGGWACSHTACGMESEGARRHIRQEGQRVAWLGGVWGWELGSASPRQLVGPVDQGGAGMDSPNQQFKGRRWKDSVESLRKRGCVRS